MFFDLPIAVLPEDLVTDMSIGLRCSICPIARAIRRQLERLKIRHSSSSVTVQESRATFEDGSGVWWSCQLPSAARLFIQKFDNPSMYDTKAEPQEFNLIFEPKWITF
jgi:hypothetical protein